MNTFDSCFLHGDYQGKDCPTCMAEKAARKQKKHVDCLSCNDCGRLVIAVNDERQVTDGQRGHGVGKCSGRWTLVASSTLPV